MQSWRSLLLEQRRISGPTLVTEVLMWAVRQILVVHYQPHMACVGFDGGIFWSSTLFCCVGNVVVLKVLHTSCVIYAFENGLILALPAYHGELFFWKVQC